MIQLNLLPDIKKEYLRAQRIRNLVVSVSIIVAIASGAVVLVLSGILGGQAIQKNVLNGSIEDNYGKINNAKENDNLNNYLTIQNQLGNINELKAEQPTYSRLLDYLRQLIPDQQDFTVSLSSVSVDGAGNTITISGTTPTFKSLAVYENILSTVRFSYSVAPQDNNSADNPVETERLFASVIAQGSLSQDESSGARVNFTIDLVYNPLAFDTNSIIEPRLQNDIFEGVTMENPTPMVFREEIT